MHLRTMQHLTSPTLVGLDLTRTYFQPQPRLQTLTLSGVCMGSTHSEQEVQNYPSLKQLSLQRLQTPPDSPPTMLLLWRLSALYLKDVEGLSAARLRRVEAFLRAQQSIGMAFPKFYHLHNG
ncbi:hypothetical protein ABBQ32_007128 [Trebouxia sp. C0010 RCD-2024]